MGSKYVSLAASGYNSGPPADDGSQTASNLTTWAGVKTKLADPVKTLTDNVNTALVTAMDYSVRQITGSDSIAASDHMKTVEIAPSVSVTAVSVTLADAATMTSNFMVRIRNSSLIAQMITRATGGDTIDGVAANITIPAKSTYTFTTNAAANGYLTVAQSSKVATQPISAFGKGIHGLTFANNSGDATNDIDIAAGGAMDATGAYWMALGTGITKRLDAPWAVGTAAGGLDAGTLADADFYIWLIARSDTGVVDALFSTSVSSPTMPSNYDFKRLIGWIKRVSNTIVAFHTYETEGGGIEMNWDVPTQDVNLANTLTTSRRTDAVKVPLNFSTIAHLNVVMEDASTTFAGWIGCPDVTDSAPGFTGAPLSNMAQEVAGLGIPQQRFVRTSSAGLVAARATLATVDVYQVFTQGFTWARRN